MEAKEKFQKLNMSENINTYRLSVSVTSVGKRGTFKMVKSFIEVETKNNPIDINDPVLIKQLTNYYTPQFADPIFSLVISKSEQLTPNPA